MENLPNELLTDVFKLVLNTDAQLCFKATKNLKHLQRLYDLQSFVFINRGNLKKRNTIAISTNVTKFEILNVLNLVYLTIKCDVFHNRLNNFTSKKLQYLTIANSKNEVYQAYLAEDFPNLKMFKCANVIISSLPKHITHMEVNSLSYDISDINQKLPQSIISINYDYMASYPRDDVLTEILSLKNLKYFKIESGDRDKTFRFTSSSITHMMLGSYFQAKVEEWPQNLTNLTTHGEFFRGGTDDNYLTYLPQSLKYLSLNRYGIGILPPNLQYLRIRYMWDPIELPINLEYFKFLTCAYYFPVLPQTIKKISIVCHTKIMLDTLNNLTQLSHLKISFFGNLNVTFAEWLNDSSLESLKYLICDGVGVVIKKIPVNLEYLSLMNCEYHESFAGSKIKTLIIGKINDPDRHQDTPFHDDPFLPQTLTYLKVAQTTLTQFPDHIKKLFIIEPINIPKLPQYLTHLCIDKLPNHTDRINFPKSLIYLKIPIFYHYFNSIPKTIETVVFVDYSNFQFSGKI